MKQDSLNPAHPADRESILAEIRGHARLFWLTGIFAVIAGLLALAMPLAASLAADYLVAGLLIAAGAAQLVAAFGAHRVKRFLPPFAVGIVAMAAGVMLFAAPLAGMVALTAIVTGVLLANGILKTAFAWRVRGASGWGWMLAAGILSLVLGILLFVGLPGTALWVIGLFLGVDLIAYGATMIGLIVTATRDPEAPGHHRHHGPPADVAG